jgi:predicted metal-dependent hydrolase
MIQSPLPFEPAPLSDPDEGRSSLETGGPDRQPDREPVFVRHPRARRYVIRVRSDGTVRVTIPRRGSKRDAVAFVQEQHAWIARQLERVESARTRPFDVTPPEVLRELREKARHELPSRLRELAAEFGLVISRVTIRDQRWRWGSCSPTGHISLNWRLVSMPDWVRDYVLIHELMHLKRLDHSPQFWKLVAAACPEYHAARKWLRTDARTSPLYCADR